MAFFAAATNSSPALSSSAALQPRQVAQPTAPALLQSPVQALSWRPPSTRRFLWERTHQGPAVVSDLGSTRIQLSVQLSTWKLLERLGKSSSGAGTISLTARLSAVSGAALQLELCTGQPTSTDITVAVAVGSSRGGQPQLQQGQLATSYEVACSRQQGAGMAQLLQLSCIAFPDAEDGSITLRGLAAAAGPVISFHPILAKCVSSQPLARTLQDSLRAGGTVPFQEGFLSMDQGRSLVPLAIDDPVAYSVPLVGVWAAGVDSVQHPLVAASALKFLCSKALADKALELDRSFLVLLYAQGRSTMPLCYECHVGLESGAVPLRVATFSASALPSAAAGHTLCDLSPAPELSLPGCPVAVGRPAGGTAAQGSMDRHSWLGPAGSRPSPGSAGSAVSVHSSAYPNRSILRTGESPAVLSGLRAVAAPAAAPPGQLNQPVRRSPPGGRAEMQSSAPTRFSPQAAPSGPLLGEHIGPAAACPPLGTGQASSAEGAAEAPTLLAPDSPDNAPAVTTPRPQQDAALASSAPDHSQSLGATLPVEGQQPEFSAARGTSVKDEARAGTAGAGALDSQLGGTAEPLLQLQSSSQSQCRLAAESIAAWSCQEECSGSMPSFAGWSAGAQPASRPSAAHSSGACASESCLQELSAEELLPPGAASVPALKAASPPIAAAAAAPELGPEPPSCHLDTTGTGIGGSDYGVSGVLWAQQIAPAEAPLSSDVPILQQEVLALRQQVFVLQSQLQAMQALPLMLPSSQVAATYADPWGLPLALAGHPWPPLLYSGAAVMAMAATPAVSVQHSCTAATSEPASQPALSPTAHKGHGSPAAAASLARPAKAGAAAGFSTADSGRIPAFRVAADSTFAGSEQQWQQQQMTANAELEQMLIVGVPAGTPRQATRLLPALGADNPGIAPATKPAAATLVAAPLAGGHPAAAACGPGIDVDWLPATDGYSDADVAAAGELMPAVTEVEADIDRLIADAERAVSVLSCCSLQDLGLADSEQDSLPMPGATAALPAVAATADPPPSSGSAGGGAPVVAARSPAAAPPAQLCGQTRSSLLSHSSHLASAAALVGLVRVKVPSFVACEGGAGAEEEDEDDELEVERLEQKYGLAGPRLSAGHSLGSLETIATSRRSRRRLGPRGSGGQR